MVWFTWNDNEQSVERILVYNMSGGRALWGFHQSGTTTLFKYSEQALFNDTEETGLINYPLTVPYIPETYGTKQLFNVWNPIIWIIFFDTRQCSMI